MKPSLRLFRTRRFFDFAVEVAMKDYESMSLQELWSHHKAISSLLQQKTTSLEARLAKRRRPYPLVKPKFQNPKSPYQTWSGRGRQPHWVDELLATGKRLEDLRII
jgi:DNA-binding protein H-NS